ncbi:hypothetical protein [Rudaea sp.]|uniref:hypothetical protein n=1 Tax=Rudaea sp. TaxID=2136325 RepID=UPI003220195A
MKIFDKLLGKKRPEIVLLTPPGPIGELQLLLTNQALELAKEFRKHLDFTNRSIQTVEAILGEVHDHYRKSKDDTGLNGIAFQLGAYIATTIQRNFNEGTLNRDDPTIGQGTFPFSFRDGTIFPFAWCQKRIFDGSADNVYSKYKVLVLDTSSTSKNGRAQ